MPGASVQSGPLAGLGAVEVGGDLAVRYCGRLPAGLGAKVARVDPIPANPSGAAQRAFLAWVDERKRREPDLASALAAVTQDGSRPLVIAGQAPKDVRAVDAALTTLAAQTAPCLRLGLTWFGDAGPYAGWRGHDAVVEALNGQSFAFGLPEGPPILPRGHAPQILGGLDLDLASADGKAGAEAIIRSADLVLENQGPGVMDRLGLGQADQRRLRPGIISISMPPFGLGGPLSGMRAYGSTVEQASGLPFVNGHEDWPPAMQHVAYGDPVAGLYGAAAAMAALYGRNTLGGAEIDLCQVECLFQLNADAIIADQMGGVTRAGSRRPDAAPVCVVPAPLEAGEEGWLAIAVDNDDAWRALCGVLADPALSADWRLNDRVARSDGIEAAIARWAAARTPEDSAGQLQAAGIAAAPVQPTHGLSRDAHLVQSGY